MKNVWLIGFLLFVSIKIYATEFVNESVSVANTYTVLNDANITIRIKGADGGNANEIGGEGASIVATFSLTAGQVIGYIVGQAGALGSNISAGGGGSTGVYIDGTLVLVAGAGAGGDNSNNAIGLGGSAGVDGLDGTGSGPGAGGTAGNGGGAGGGGNDSGGGGGINSPGADGDANSLGGGQATGSITFASGGTGDSGSNGGQGFTGGGGADTGAYSGGGGGYAGGGGAGANGGAGGGGSYVNTAYTGYVSSTITAGIDGGGTESDGSIIISDSAILEATVDYRMDECYWLDGAGGVVGDVKDTSTNQFDATSSGAASIIRSASGTPLCHSGDFTAQPDLVDADDGTAGNTAGGISVSVWLKPSAMTNWQAIVTKSKAYNWDDGWGIVHYSGDNNNQIRFFVNTYSNNISGTLTLNVWNHVMVTYDRTTMRLYINGTEVSNKAYTTAITNSASADPIRIAYDDNGDDEYIGGVDEMKVWTSALSATDVNTIYTNELAGKNYDGSTRICPTCDANATAGIWGLIGIPADFRTAANKDVADVFDEFPSGSYNVSANTDGWVVFKRDYNTTSNASSYSIVPYTGLPLEFGQGYWLITKVDQAWSENGLPNVDYNSTDSACVNAPCVEIDLTSVTLNFGAPDNDPNDGTGRNRNNMLGFAGHTPVDWADCRILVDGVAYTPSGAETAGYADKQVWQYNPGVSGANANGYTTCDDTTPGGCKLEPYKGFWIILHGLTKNKTVKLLIPKE